MIDEKLYEDGIYDWLRNMLKFSRTDSFRIAFMWDLSIYLSIQINVNVFILNKTKLFKFWFVVFDLICQLLKLIFLIVALWVKYWIAPSM